jgi:hypothetical protein
MISLEELCYYVSLLLFPAGMTTSEPSPHFYGSSAPTKESYTSEEYWTWAQRHSSPTSSLQRQQKQQQQQQQQPTDSPSSRSSRGRRPRVTRKLSADSLMDYRTYQMDDIDEPTHSPRSASQAPSAGRSYRTNPTYCSVASLTTPSMTMSRTRPSSGGDPTDVVKPISSSGSSSKIKDLPLSRKPLQIRTEDFRVYQPDLEDRKARFERSVDGQLSVHVLCGHGLKSSRTMLRDLYCVIEVDSVNKARTMIRTGAINFDWDEAFDVDIENAREMSFLVFSWDPNTRHRLCFSSTVGLQAFLHAGHNQKIALKLEPMGILYLDIVYKEPSVTLQRTPSLRKTAMFGVDLETIIRREKSGLGVPIVVRKCIDEVEKRGLEHIGIYRLCGSARRKAQLKEEFERSAKLADVSADAVSDINVITGKPL